MPPKRNTGARARAAENAQPRAEAVSRSRSLTTRAVPGTPQRITVSVSADRRETSPSEEETLVAAEENDTTNESSAVCPICENAILDATESELGEDAIFCDGRCKRWLHRCCACLPKHEFLELKDSEMPFYCSRCNAQRQELGIKDLRATMQALSAQVEELRLTVSTVVAQRCIPQPQSQPSQPQPESWSTVARKGRKTGGKKAALGNGSVNATSKLPHKSSNRETINGGLNPPTDKPEQARSNAVKRHKQPVPGKRRIWGTMKQCNAGAVNRAVILQTTKVSNDSIEVRRKYKTLDNNRLRWWHVVSGEEEILKQLEGEWEGVQCQTGWKIEPCLAFSTAVELPLQSPDPTHLAETQPSPTLLPPFSLRVHLRETSTPLGVNSCRLHAGSGGATTVAPCQTTVLGVSSNLVNLNCSNATNSSQLSIIYFNARSLLPKISELQTVCLALDPDIVCITESWLADAIEDLEIKIPGYSCSRLNRDRHGGGLVMYFKSTVEYKPISLEPGNVELSIISFYKSNCRVCIALFYRPPNCSVTVFDTLYTTLQSLHSALFSNLVLL